MYKLIMAFTLGLAPFFSLAYYDLFSNENVDSHSPKMTTNTKWTCRTQFNGTQDISTQSLESQDVDQATMYSMCQPDVQEYLEANATFPYGCELDSSEWVEDNSIALRYYGGNQCNGAQLNSLAFVLYTPFKATVQEAECPPDEQPNATYPRDGSGNGEIDSCFDPAQLNQNDSCDANSGDEFLSIPVTTSTGCYAAADGSQCKYNATQFNGVEAYAMDLEGDCYSDNDLPAIDGTPADVPQSQDDNCSSWGGNGMVCPENPEDVCDANGNCQEGCGTVNGVYACFDNDNDSDGVPDYIDPDIDGDGIPNSEDPDEDGDGIYNENDTDTPNGTSNTGGSTNGGTSGGGDGNSGGLVTVDIDLKPVVDELKDINDSMSNTSVERQQQPTEGLTGFYESVYEDGIEGMFEGKTAEFQGTEFYLFLNQFKPSFGGSPPDMTFCMNFGTYMNLGCFTLNLDPRIWPALKIFILVTAGFTCRKILFGG
ncbi:MAG: hypothetical protein HRT54_15945 [Colwellia sp.]|nr:hypothetical protein [Colwellia sp.]